MTEEELTKNRAAAKFVADGMVDSAAIVAENERARIGGNFPPEPIGLDAKHAQIIADVETLAEKGMALPPAVESDDDVSLYGEVIVAARKLATRIDDTRKAENEPLRSEIKANDAFFNAHAERMSRMKEILERRADEYRTRKADEERKARAAEAARLQAEADERLRLAAEAAKSGGIEQEMAVTAAEKANDAAAKAARDATATDAELTRTRTAGGTMGTKTEWDFRVADYSLIDLNELRESFNVDAIDKAIRAHVKRHKKTRALKGVEIFSTSKAAFRG